MHKLFHRKQRNSPDFWRSITASKQKKMLGRPSIFFLLAVIERQKSGLATKSNSVSFVCMWLYHLLLFSKYLRTLLEFLKYLWHKMMEIWRNCIICASATAFILTSSFLCALIFCFCYAISCDFTFSHFICFHTLAYVSPIKNVMLLNYLYFVWASEFFSFMFTCTKSHPYETIWNYMNEQEKNLLLSSHRPARLKHTHTTSSLSTTTTRATRNTHCKLWRDPLLRKNQK